MNTPAVAYRNYFLRCKGPKQCAIPLPRPIRIDTDGGLLQITTENRRAIFACPHCGLVCAYYGQEIVEMLIVGTPDLFQAGECRLVSSEVECDGKNCEAPKLVHAILGVSTGTWRAKVAPKDWSFSETAVCRDDHQLRLDSAVAHWTTTADDPF